MRNASLVYVVTGDHATANSLEAAALPWVEEGLMDPFLVITSADVDASDDPPARWVGGAGEQTVLTAAATSRVDTIRIASFQAIRRGGSGDWAVKEAAVSLRDRMLARIAPTQSLYLLNVIAPDEHLRGLPMDLLSLAVTANVVIAPEDRTGPGTTAHSFDDPHRLAAHAAMNLFGVAGLWRTQVRGPLDDASLSAPSETPMVVMTRGFGRLVRDPDLVARVVTEMLGRRSNSDWIARAGRMSAAADPFAIASTQADTLFSRHQDLLSAPRPMTPVREEPRKIGIIGALVRFFRFIFSGFSNYRVAVTTLASSMVRTPVAEFAQSLTYGNNSTVRVTRPDESVETAIDRVDEIAEIAHQLIARAGGGTATAPADASVWRDLRRLSFSLLDGSDLPVGFDAPMAGAEREIVADPAAITPDPTSPGFRADPQLPLSPYAKLTVSHVDPLHASAVATELFELARAQDPELQELANAESGRLERWMSVRSRSLHGRFAELLGTQILSGHAVLMEALAALQGGSDSSLTAAIAAARATLIRRWKVILITLAAFSLLRLVQVQVGSITTDVTGVIRWVASVLGLALVVTYACWLAFQRRLFQAEHQLLIAAKVQDAALRTAQNAAIRLIGLTEEYRRLAEWATVIGHLAHHPTAGGVEGLSRELRDLGFLPASHRVGVVADGGANDGRLAAISARSVFRQGWLNALYEMAEEQLMTELKHQQGEPEDAPNPDPDAPQTGRIARTHLREGVVDGRPQSRWTSEQMDVVAGCLDDVATAELFASVRDGDEVLPGTTFLHDVVADIGAEQTGPHTLATDLWTAPARMDHAEQITDVSIAISSALEIADHDRVHVDVLPIRGEARGGLYEVLMIRVDRTSPTAATRLELFADVHMENVTTPLTPTDHDLV